MDSLVCGTFGSMKHPNQRHRIHYATRQSNKTMFKAMLHSSKRDDHLVSRIDAVNPTLKSLLETFSTPSVTRKSHIRTAIPLRRQVDAEPEATLRRLAPFVQTVTDLHDLALDDPIALERLSETVTSCATSLEEHAAISPELCAMALEAIAERLLQIIQRPMLNDSSIASSIESVLATPPSSYLYVKDIIRISSFQSAALFTNSPVAVAVRKIG